MNRIDYLSTRIGCKEPFPPGPEKIDHERVTTEDNVLNVIKEISLPGLSQSIWDPLALWNPYHMDPLAQSPHHMVSPPSRDLWQVDGWPSTERPSCVVLCRSMP